MVMGIEGAGYLFVHPDRVRTLNPLTAGWLSHESPIEFLLGGPADSTTSGPWCRVRECSKRVRGA
jgi:kynureninase